MKQMKQLRVLLGQSRFQLLVALTALVVATTVAIGSGASFTAQTANPSNVFTSGTLSMSNTPTGMSTTISNMVPGEFHSGTVVMKNTGTVRGRFYLEPVTISDDTKGLAAQAQLLIMDGETEVYSGTLAGLTQKDLGTWAVNETHTYAFTVTLPDQGRDGRDNAFMAATTTAAFNWTAVSVPAASSL